MNTLKTLAAVAAIALGGTAASADTLDFISFGAGQYGSMITVSGADITNLSGGDILVGAGAAGQANGFCSLNPNAFNCEADTEIDFNQTVSNLSFWLDGSGNGDMVAISAYNGNTLLATQNYTTPDQLIDLSALGNITRLVMDDSSTAAGYGYSRFDFNSMSQVPVPASLPLLLGGVALIGAMKRRRKS